MALVTSSMLPLGTDVPVFSLPEPRTGKTISSMQFKGHPLLVAVICNHCPYVKRIKGGLALLARDLQKDGVATVAISGNDAQTYPSDSPEKMAEDARTHDYSFPYLFDESQEVVQAFRAACTPEFYLFDQNGRLRYRGQMDDARPGNEAPNDGRDIRAAVAALLINDSPLAKQTPSIGCSIKWRPGNEPDYLG